MSAYDAADLVRDIFGPALFDPERERHAALGKRRTLGSYRDSEYTTSSFCGRGITL